MNSLGSFVPLYVIFPKGICLSALALLAPQDLGSLQGPPPRTHQFIAYAAEQQTVPVHRRTVVQLSFHVDSGYHVNSHTPKSELLIPTSIQLQPTQGIKADSLEYPAGKPYAFAFDPTEKLDVYADNFTVMVPVTAAAVGTYTLHGVLRYQACDKAACYPARALPIDILLTATSPSGTP